MPILQVLFEKDIQRYIGGVVKADDKDHLLVEVEEYVITTEVAKRLESFLDVYNSSHSENGSWISGFFGSGKSHILKMLALLLENPTLEDGSNVKDHFIKKSSDNAILKGLIEKAVSFPSQNILFNIDNKADQIGRDNSSAILSVFLKVFNELNGYNGSLPYVAQFERDLDEEGKYQQFIAAFEKISQKPWKIARETPLFISNETSNAYQAVTGQNVNGISILDRYSKDFKLSIETFAGMIKKYIDKQPKNFRLNFFIDEIGQFIADNTQMMLDLQTITEALFTQCKGRAWVVVTSQEAIDKVVGNINASQSNDFSKIQARFTVRLPMSSESVEEVIQKRLLAKNANGSTQIKNIYPRVKENFGTLFNFTDGTQTFKSFRDEQHFINSYPFIPYQYELFQVSLQELSVHNAFEGRNAAVGERSMLAVFQEVLKSMKSVELSQVATFDMMYEGIRGALKSQAITSIRQAEENLPQNLGKDFAIRVLKALFLVKYVKGFKSTLANITILMTDRLDPNIKELRARVQDALNLLERETYIERSGVIYSFLTDDEKDIEAEIKNTSVDRSTILEQMKDIFFSNIINASKIRYAKTNQDFAFAKFIDAKSFSREEELKIKLITPFYEHSADLKLLCAHSLGTSELLIALPQNPTLMTDLTIYKRTEKYLMMNRGTQNQNIEIIIRTKGAQNEDRLREIEKLVKEDLTKATIIISGEEHPIPMGEPIGRIQTAFQILVDKTYPNLLMLGNTHYTEAMVPEKLRLGQNLPGFTITPNQAEQEVFNWIQSQKLISARVSVKSVTDKFEKKPYGWSLAAVECVLAGLFAQNLIDLYQNSSHLSQQDLATRLVTTSNHETILLEAHTAVSADKIRKLKTFYRDFFDMPDPADERALADAVSQAIKDKLHELREIYSNHEHLAFLQDLSQPINLLNEHVAKPSDHYFGEFLTHTDELLDLKDNIVKPILDLHNGEKSQNKIFTEARDYYNSETDNFASAGAEQAKLVHELLTDPTLYKGGKVVQLKQAHTNLRDTLQRALEEARNVAFARAEGLKNDLVAYPAYNRITQEQRQTIDQRFLDLNQAQLNTTSLSSIAHRINQFATSDFQDLLNEMEGWINDGKTKVPTVIPIGSLPRTFQYPYLATKEDVNDYLSALKETLLTEITKGNKIDLH